MSDLLHELEHIASEDSQQDWMRLEYGEIHRKAFIRGGEYIASQAADTIEQLQQRNVELEATVERLREALNQSLISWGYVGVPNEEGETYKECEKRLEETPHQNLNAVKREGVLILARDLATTGEVDRSIIESIESYANQRYPDKDGE